MNCRFLHHMKYKPKKFAFEGGRRKLNGFAGRCRNKGCTFIATVLEPPTRDIRSRRIKVSADSLYAILTGLISRRTTSRTSPEASPNPTEKAGAPLHSTSAPVPSIGA
ncbi:hypothetical protein LCGC14_3062650 [marine sediment metagenome]|uniref:Uncharacterized protein n=1 Tax=marine sediment metagenome TaxID=412755 RepID=A0A0F8YR54_9ZZZZ